MFLQPATPLPLTCQPPVRPDSGAASHHLGHLGRPTDTWPCGNTLSSPSIMSQSLVTHVPIASFPGLVPASLPLGSWVSRCSPGGTDPASSEPLSA